MTDEAVQARADELPATHRPLLDAIGSVQGLMCTLRDLADLLVASEDSGRVAAGCRDWKSLLAAGITRARHNGDLSPDVDPDRLATGVLAALRGGLLLARTTRDVGQLETALDMALGYVQAHAVTR